jgi:hypothetical protein
MILAVIDNELSLCHLLVACWMENVRRKLGDELLNREIFNTWKGAIGSK